jgi:CTP-dependent riboflavin kinase
VALLRNKDPIVGYDEKTFFDPSMLSTSLENNMAYLSIVNKTFHEFKVVEIINEREVRDHFSFVHPIYVDEDY